MNILIFPLVMPTDPVPHLPPAQEGKHPPGQDTDHLLVAQCGTQMGAHDSLMPAMTQSVTAGLN